MKATMLSDGTRLSIPPIDFKPGDKVDWREKNIRPLIDGGSAIEGHVDVTEKAARLAKRHKVDLHALEGTGAGGRILVSDVRDALESAEDEEDAE